MTDTNNIVYLDNNATTRVDPTVLEAMLPFLESHYANPSSPYTLARSSSQAIARAREAVASALGAEPGDVTFTGSATEANNTALAAAVALRPSHKHVVTTRVEHVSVLAYCRFLASTGYEISYLEMNDDGVFDLEDLEDALREDTAVVSIMAANNETGLLLPWREAAERCHKRGILFHTDAVQAVGKIPVNLKDVPVDFFSLSGHKLHGPKGIGALYARGMKAFPPFMRGGEQEFGRRGGTENVPGIVGLGAAIQQSIASLDDAMPLIADLHLDMERRLVDAIPGLHIVGRGRPRLPNTTCFLLDGLESDAVLALLDMKGICCSSGSACMSGSSEPSHVLKAMGTPSHLAKGAVRVSSSRFTTPDDMEYLISTLPGIVSGLVNVR